MSDLPSGNVTFLFSDIEGSTRRWETDETAMWADVQLHNEVMTQAIRDNGGHPFKMVGDAFQAAFHSAPDALNAVVDAQRRLAEQTWTGGSVLRVRMALHTGEAEPRDGDYLAPSLNRLARMMSAGFGGQVLLSSLTAGLVREALPADVTLRDLGRHRLKDLNQPEQIFQVVGPGLLDDFPALKTLDSRPHNLPLQTTSLIGRDDDIALVLEMLARADTRLVTLTGPGGAGKTRLGLQVGAEALDDFADGVSFVPLAAVSDPSLVLSAIATALRIQETGGVPVAQLLADSLDHKQLLLVLDNFEQVVDAAGDIADLLRACPRVMVLATSRIRLGIYGEREYPVPPLDLPDPADLPLLADLAENQSVHLFVDRATAVKPDFALNDANAQAVAEICIRLDGLPLALELAAARVRLLTPKAMLERMEKRLPLLTGGARDLPARHQTLRNTIAWSYDLLSADEQRLYRRLAIFAGGWTIEAAETVVEISDFDDPYLDCVDGLSALVDHNLVRQTAQADGLPRFLMLQTIREYGLEQLTGAGESDCSAVRHASYYVDLAESFDDVVFGPEQVLWLDRLELELNNLRSAVQWSMSSGRPELALRLAGALRRFWELRGHIQEGRGWLETALSAVTESTAVRARALDSAGNLVWRQGETELARQLYRESLEINRELDQVAAVAETISNIGYVAIHDGDVPRAIALFEESLQMFREQGNQRWIGNLLANLSVPYGIAGDLDRAEELLRESLEIQRKVGNDWGAAVALENLSMVASERGDYREAIRILRESLAVYRGLRGDVFMVDCLGGLADLYALLGDAVKSAFLYGVEDAQRARMHTEVASFNRETRDQSMAIIQATLTDAEYKLHYQEGKGTPLQHAVERELLDLDCVTT